MSERSTSLAHSLQKGEGTNHGTAGALLAIGVYVLSPPRRLALAQRLDDDGVTSEQVTDLFDYLCLSEPDRTKAIRFVVAILADPIKTREAIDSLREHRAVTPKPPPSEPEYGTHQRGFPCPYWLCECSACDQARARGVPNQGEKPVYLVDGVAPPKRESWRTDKGMKDDADEEHPDGNEHERRKVFIQRMRQRRLRLLPPSEK